jgi:phosphoglycolate phosphatase
MFKAVLFDLDGTLLYTLKDVADAMNKALVHFGYLPHPVDAYKYFIGDSNETAIRRALPESAHDPELIRKITTYSEELYDKCWGDNTYPYEGIPELLTELQRRGLTLVILSNKNDRFTKAMVKKILPAWPFEIVQGAIPEAPLKPDPTLALRIAKKLRIPPEQFLYLGDTNTDMQTAVSAGMFPIGCVWGYRTADELLESGAKLLIDNPLDVPGFIDNPRK